MAGSTLHTEKGTGVEVMQHLVFGRSKHRVFAILLAVLVTAIVIVRFGASASSRVAGTTPVAQVDQSQATITVRAAKRGNPRMNLQDGRSVAASYQDATTHAASSPLTGTRPLSLASGD